MHTYLHRQTKTCRMASPSASWMCFHVLSSSTPVHVRPLLKLSRSSSSSLKSIFASQAMESWFLWFFNLDLHLDHHFFYKIFLFYFHLFWDYHFFCVMFILPELVGFAVIFMGFQNHFSHSQRLKLCINAWRDSLTHPFPSNRNQGSKSWNATCKLLS